MNFSSGFPIPEFLEYNSSSKLFRKKQGGDQNFDKREELHVSSSYQRSFSCGSYGLNTSTGFFRVTNCAILQGM